jgi:hypothetical protein
MAVNTSKTQFTIFRNQGAVVREEDCNIVFNSNVIGFEEIPSLITHIDRIHNAGNEKSFKLIGVLFDYQHTTHLYGKISRPLYAIRKIKN